jgi:hypothetical protein
MMTPEAAMRIGQLLIDAAQGKQVNAFGQTEQREGAENG